MRKKQQIGMFLAVLFFLLFPIKSWAQDGRVDDQAGVFTETEQEELEVRTQTLSEHNEMDFVVVTTMDAQGKSAMAYADDYYDSHGYREDGVLYLIDLDNGEIWISTKGMMIRYLTDERIQKVIDEGYSELKAQRYGAGILRMLDATENYLEVGIQSGQFNYDPETGKTERYRSITGGEVLWATVIAVLCGGGFFAVILSSYKLKKKTYRYAYDHQGRVQFRSREDRLINRVVTHHPIPKDPPPSSGGGGQSTIHTSSSGSSHGGGGRSL